MNFLPKNYLKENSDEAEEFSNPLPRKFDSCRTPNIKLILRYILPWWRAKHIPY